MCEKERAFQGAGLKVASAGGVEVSHTDGFLEQSKSVPLLSGTFPRGTSSGVLCDGSVPQGSEPGIHTREEWEIRQMGLSWDGGRCDFLGGGVCVEHKGTISDGKATNYVE